MMKTLIAIALIAAVGLAVAPEAAAQPLPCTASVGTQSGYVACCPVLGLSVSYGGTYRCIPPH